MYNVSNSSPTLINCIIWGDTPDEIFNSSSTATVTYSDVEGGWGGTGNIDADPLFVNAALGDLRLRSSASPCVDAGDNNTPGVPTTDLAGNPRIVDGDRNGTDFVDIGAYEFQSGLIHNITQDLWYEIIQAAIDAANPGEQIEVGPETYYEAIKFKGKAVRLYSSGGPEVTTINGTGHYHVVQCISGEDANTILDGFTITGGNASGVPWPHYHGGGMLNIYSSPTVSNCTFTENSSQHWGGGMYNDRGSHTTLINCTFSGNISDTGGAGMSNYASSPTVTNCTFTDNSANDGGGMYNANNSHPNVTNCILWGDTPDEVNNVNSTTTVTYSDVEGGYGGVGNINADPCFVDANHPDTNLWNLRLKPGSPCIDGGDTTAVPTGIFADADGNLRGVDDPQTHDTGLSILGVTVDMGAYEFQLCRIPGDINCDGLVNFKDLAILCNNWLSGAEPE